MSLKDRLNLKENEISSQKTISEADLKYDEFFNTLISDNLNIIISCPFEIQPQSILKFLNDKLPQEKRLVVIGTNLDFTRDEIIKFTPDINNTDKNLIKTAIELKPFKIILENFSGVEAVDILKLANSGIKNIISTVAAKDVQTVLTQIELNMYSSGLNIPELLMKKIISTFIDFVIEVKNCDNKIFISKLYKIKSFKNNEYQIEDAIFSEKEKKQENKFDIKGFEPKELNIQPSSAAETAPDILKKKLTKPAESKAKRKNLLSERIKQKVIENR